MAAGCEKKKHNNRQSAKSVLKVQGVTCAAYSRDGNTIIFGTDKYKVFTWDLLSNKHFLTYTNSGWKPNVKCKISISPKCDKIAYSDVKGEIILVNTSEPNKPYMLTDEGEKIRNLVFSSNGDAIAAAIHGGKWRLIDVAKGKSQMEVGERGYEYSNLVFSPNGRDIAFDSKDGSIHIWNISKRKEDRVLIGTRSSILKLAYSPDAKTLAVASEGEAIRFYLTSGRKEANHVLLHQSRVESLAFSPDGSIMASGDDDGLVCLWSRHTGNPLSFKRHYRGKIFSLAFSSDGSSFCTAGEDGSVKLWNSITHEEIRRLETHAKKLAFVAFCLGDKFIVFYASDGRIRLWSLEQSKEVYYIDVAIGFPALSLSPNGRQLAVARGVSITLWDLLERKIVKQIHLAPDSGPLAELVGVERMVYSMDGKILAIASSVKSSVDRHKLVLYDVLTGQRMDAFLFKQILTPSSLSFIDNGKSLACGTVEGNIVYWNIMTGESFLESGKCGEIVSMCYDANDVRLVTGNSDTTVLFWRAPHWKKDVNEGLSVSVGSNEYYGNRWASLRSQTDNSFFDAFRLFVRDGDDSVAFIRRHLQPIPEPDMELITQCIRSLSDDQFEVRKKSFAQLKRFGDLAFPQLHHRLREAPLLDEKKLIQQLLREENVLTPDQLRNLRAIQILEYIGTSDAKDLLCLISTGSTASRLTRSASASLKRLNGIKAHKCN